MLDSVQGIGDTITVTMSGPQYVSSLAIAQPLLASHLHVIQTSLFD